MKSNKSISRKNFLIKFHFWQFQKWPKINFLTGKKFKTAKIQFHEKKIFFCNLFDFTTFFAWNFFIFLAHLCETIKLFCLHPRSPVKELVLLLRSAWPKENRPTMLTSKTSKRNLKLRVWDTSESYTYVKHSGPEKFKKVQAKKKLVKSN